MNRTFSIFFTLLAFSLPASALDKHSRPAAALFEASAPSRYRLTHTATAVVTGTGTTSLTLRVPKPARLPWSIGAGAAAAFENVALSGGTAVEQTVAEPWHQNGHGYWLELSNCSPCEVWDWALPTLGAGTTQHTYSFEYTTCDRRFRRESLPLVMTDLSDAVKVPVELQGVKAAIRAMTEPYGETDRPMLPPELTQAVDAVLAQSGASGDIYKVLTRLSQWLTGRLTYSASAGVLTSIRHDLYTNLSRGTGDCGTFSCMFVAMANAAGIPARVQVGLNTVPFAQQGYADTVGFHVWVEVFLPGAGWVELEPQGTRGYTANADGVAGCDIFNVSQYSQHQNTQQPYYYRKTNVSGSTGASVTFQSGLTKLSGPRFDALTIPRGYPSCVLTSPANYSAVQVGTSVTMTVNVAAASGAVLRRVCFGAGNRRHTAIAPPYQFTFTPTAAAEEWLWVYAEDSFGSYSYAVLNPSPGAMPLVFTTLQVTSAAPSLVCRVTAPANGGTLAAGGAVTIQTSITGSGVNRVKFWATTNAGTWLELGTDTTAPFSWSYTPSAPGSQNVYAEFINSAGTALTSAETAFHTIATMSEWKSRNFSAAQLTNTTISGALADPGNRGLRNLQAYAFGLASTGAIAGGIPKLEGTTLNGIPYRTFSFRRPYPKPSDVTYTVQRSSTLGAWENISPEVSTNLLSSSVSGGIETLTLGTPESSTPSAYFYRVVVAGP